MDNRQEDGSGDSGSDNRVNPVVSPPTSEEVQRVEAERMGEAMGAERGSDQGPAFQFRPSEYRFGHRDSDGGGIRIHYASDASGMAPFAKPPLLATWLCLLIAWVFLGSKLPFTVLLGLPLNVLALFLAAVSLSRGGVITGMLVFLLGTAGSLVVYLIGLFRLLAH